MIEDGTLVLAESGAILEYLAGRYGGGTLSPAAGSAEHVRYLHWMHFAEGSLMNWLVMKLVFMTIPTQPMPFFVRPIARQLCAQVLKKLVDPNVGTALAFIEDHLGKHAWFAGEQLSIADFQMSFPVEAALARSGGHKRYPNMRAYQERMEARSAYRRALEKGGPVVMSA